MITIVKPPQTRHLANLDCRPRGASEQRLSQINGLPWRSRFVGHRNSRAGIESPAAGGGAARGTAAPGLGDLPPVGRHVTNSTPNAPCTSCERSKANTLLGTSVGADAGQVPNKQEHESRESGPLGGRIAVAEDCGLPRYTAPPDPVRYILAGSGDPSPTHRSNFRRKPRASTAGPSGGSEPPMPKRLAAKICHQVQRSTTTTG